MDDQHYDTVPDHPVFTERFAERANEPWGDMTVRDLAIPTDWDVTTLVTHRAPRPRLGSAARR